MAPSTPLRIRLVALSLGCAVLTAAPPASHAQAKPASEQRAREKFRVAQRAYREGDFELALSAYSEAYELEPLPGFLFNIAQCHRQLGHYERAEFFYRQYLSVASLSRADSQLVRSLISEAQMRRAQIERVQRREGQDVPSVKQPPAPPPSREATAAGREQLEVTAQPAELDRVAAEAARSNAVPVSGATKANQQLTKQWWFWAGVGVLVVGVGSSIYFATEPKARATTLPAINGRPP